jgi:hypothetical protein
VEPLLFRTSLTLRSCSFHVCGNIAITLFC